jgi:predicted transcriptional regulator
MKNKVREKLGERELDIMQALWTLGQATVGDVQQALLNAKHQVAYNTVQTMLNRLEAKGLVSRDQSDRAHLYKPLVKEPKAVGGAIKQLTNRFFKGSVEALAIRLVEKELDQKQLARIQEIIDAHRKKEPKE